METGIIHRFPLFSGPYYPESQVTGFGIGGHADPVSGTQVLGSTVPTPSPDYPTVWNPIGGTIGCIPIPAPFIHIYVHIIEAPRIRRKTPYSGCPLPVYSQRTVGIGIGSIIVTQSRVYGIPHIKGGDSACSTGIFPFRFRG